MTPRQLGNGVGIAGVIAFALIGAYTFGHATGLRVVLLGVEAIVLIAVRLSMAEHEPKVPPAESVDRNAGFPRYRYYVSALRFANNRRVDFDDVTRPALARLFSQVLADRHDITIAGNSDKARALIGERAASYLLDSGKQSPAPHAVIDRVDRATLEGLVRKLEELAR